MGIPCPWRHLTNSLCPFCGSTSLGAALLRGDIGAAWAANQFVFVLLSGLTITCGIWLVEWLGGPRLRLPRRMADQRLWYVALGTIAVLFAVVRNLVPLT